jgi:hypothetical protein
MGGLAMDTNTPRTDEQISCFMITYKVTVDSENTTRWYNDKNQFHRVDGPAIEWANGTKAWYLNDKHHRVDGPAVEWANGTKEWYLNDKRHRIDGPAIEHADGNKYWCLNNKLHRIDGPAVEGANGDKEWWLNNKKYTEAEFNGYIKPKPSCEGKVVEVDGVKYRLVKACP